MNDIRRNLLSVIHKYYIKYNRLDEITAKIAPTYYNSPVEIYIDLHDIISRLLSINNIYLEHPFALVEGVMNMVAHYKNYFKSRKRMNVTVFLINANDSCGHRQQYLRLFGNKKYLTAEDCNIMMHRYKEQCNMIKIISAYLPSTFYIERSVDFSTVAYDMCHSGVMHNFIISKDRLALQLPAFNKDNAVLLIPNKYNKEDISKCITCFDVLKEYYNRINNEKKAINLNKLSPEMIYLFMALGGIPEYNLPRTFNNNIITDILCNAIESSIILNSYSGDIDYLYNALDKIRTKISYNDFVSVVRTVDPVYHLAMYKTMPEYLDKTWFVYFKNPEAIEEVNRTYFKDHPLDIITLMGG